jgi:hypothetical protein
MKNRINGQLGRAVSIGAAGAVSMPVAVGRKTGPAGTKSISSRQPAAAAMPNPTHNHKHNHENKDPN